MKLTFRLKRLYKFEYWSFWVFYFPFTLQWLYYSLRSLSFVYFTRANYKTPFGAFFQYSKYSLIKDIDEKYIPKTLLFNSIEELKSSFDNPIFNQSFIYKPDFGERGKGVTLYHSLNDLKNDLTMINMPCQIQQYIDQPIELGVLFYRFPSGSKGITSVVSKRFLTVTGDGKKTLEQLIGEEIRASTRIDFLNKKFSSRWNEVISTNESIVLEEIGNHNRGTTFLNSNNLINEKLVSVMDDITKNISGFHYGRIDLKCASIEGLYKGEGISILEVNGVASEAGHIYDPNMSLFRAYRDVFLNNEIVFKISRELQKKGIKTPNTLIEFIQAWLVQRKR